MHERCRHSSGTGGSRSQAGGTVADAGTPANGHGGAVPGRSGGADPPGAPGDGGGGEAGLGTLLRAHPGPRRGGGAGRDRPATAGGVVAVRLHSRHRLGAGVGAAVRGQRGLPLAVRRGGDEPPFAVGLPQRSWRGAGWFVHAGNRLVGGPASGAGEPGEPGRSAGAGSFRREERLQELLEKAQEQVAELRRQVDAPEYAAQSARQKAVRQRVAAEKQQRLEQAIAQLPELQQKQAEAAQRAGQGQRGQQIRERQPRVSTTDAEARRMKMPNGGFNPAVNVQLATDTASRAIVGVEVSNEGSDNVGLSEPMRQQVEERTQRKIAQHLLDGGYLRKQDLERAHQQGVEVFVPPNPRARRRTGGENWNPNPETAQRCGRGSSAWRAKQGNKSINNGRPPAKPSTPTCEVIAG